MSPKNEEQFAVIRDARREKILAAALRVFATKGYSATRISDIAVWGKMSHGLIYHYFSSKEEIFFELVKTAMQASSQSLRMVESMPLSPIEKVRQTAKYILKAIDSGEDTSYYFLITIHASIMEAPGEKNKLLAGSDDTVIILKKILDEGQKAGEIIEGDTLEMAIAFFAAIEGIAIFKLNMPYFKLPDYELLANMVKKNI